MSISGLRRAVVSRMSSLRQLARTVGAGFTALYLLDRILRRLSGGRAFLVVHLLMAQPVATPAEPARASGKWRVERITPEHALAAQLPRPPAVNSARWRQGAECHALVDGDTLAATLWIQPCAHDEEEVRCRYRIGAIGRAVWDFDLLILPRYRLSRAFSTLWSRVQTDLKARGVEWSLSQISPFNEPSMRAHARLGARRIGWTGFLRVGNWQLTCASREPRWHRIGPQGDAPAYTLNVD